MEGGSATLDTGLVIPQETRCLKRGSLTLLEKALFGNVSQL